MNFEPNFDELVKAKVGRRIVQILANRGTTSSNDIVENVKVEDLELKYDTIIGITEIIHVMGILRKNGYVKNVWINLTPELNTEYLDQGLALTPVGAAKHRKGLL